MFSPLFRVEKKQNFDYFDAPKLFSDVFVQVKEESFILKSTKESVNRIIIALNANTYIRP